MKFLMVTLLFCLGIFSGLKSQKIHKQEKYFFLGSGIGHSKSIKPYTLKTKTLYPSFDKEIKLYNYYLSPSEFILFSVFPNVAGKEDWIELDSSEYINLMTNEEIESLYNTSIRKLSNNIAEIENVKRLDLVPVIKKNGKLYMPGGLFLAELFFVTSNKSGKVFPNESVIAEIDTFAPPMSFSEFRDKFNLAKKDKTIRDPAFNEGSGIRNNAQTPRLFRSQTSELMGMNAYHFWTYSNLFCADWYCYERGIGRFIYIPEKGIVGGAFDFFFNYEADNGSNTKFRDEYRKNIVGYRIEEKVMIAEELKK